MFLEFLKKSIFLSEKGLFRVFLGLPDFSHNNMISIYTFSEISVKKCFVLENAQIQGLDCPGM